MADLESKMRMILAGTLGSTGYVFLAARVTNEPGFGKVMLDAVTLAYELGCDDERVRLAPGVDHDKVLAGADAWSKAIAAGQYSLTDVHEFALDDQNDVLIVHRRKN